MRTRTFLNEIRLTSKLAAPICAMFLANMLMQIEDTFFVGRLGPESLGGLSIGMAVFNTFMVMGMGLLFGLDFFVAKAFGQKKTDECRDLLTQGLYMALIAALPLVAVMNLAPLGFRAFGLSETISAHATAFLRPLSLSLVPFLMLNACRMYLQGQGDGKTAFYVVIAANVLNIFLNPILIFGKFGFHGLGVQGSGCSTLVGRWFSFLLIAWFVRRHNKKHRIVRQKYDFEHFLETQKKLLHLGAPAAGQLVLEVGVFALITFVIGRLTPVELAAHQIVLHLASLTFMVPLGISAAAAVRVGQAVGRRHPNRVRVVGWSALLLSFLVMSSFAVILYSFGGTLLGIFSKDAAVIRVGEGLLLIAALFQISDGFQVTAAGALRGIGDTKASLWANFAGHWLLGLPLGVFLCLGAPKLRATGAWIGLSVGLTTVAIILTTVWIQKSKSQSGRIFL